MSENTLSLRDQYLTARNRLRELKQMKPGEVVQDPGFRVRPRWAIRRLLLPTFTRLEEELSDQAGKLLADGKTVRMVSNETGLPRRRVEKISKWVKNAQWIRVRQLQALNTPSTP
jgi:hypothetical protein